MSNLIPRWGYSVDDAKIFHLEEGEDLPDGYFDSPAKVGKKPKPAKKVTKKSEEASPVVDPSEDAE